MAAMVEQAAVTVTRAARFDYGGVMLLDKLVDWGGARSKGLVEIVADGRCWVVKHEGEVVGFAVFTPSFFERWIVEQVVVHPDHRRRGIATALLRQCAAVCPEPQHFTTSPTSNAPMRALLDKLGYEPSGQIDHLRDDDPQLILVKRRS